MFITPRHCLSIGCAKRKFSNWTNTVTPFSLDHHIHHHDLHKFSIIVQHDGVPSSPMSRIYCIPHLAFINTFCYNDQCNRFLNYGYTFKIKYQNRNQITTTRSKLKKPFNPPCLFSALSLTN